MKFSFCTFDVVQNINVNNGNAQVYIHRYRQADPPSCADMTLQLCMIHWRPNLWNQWSMVCSKYMTAMHNRMNVCIYQDFDIFMRHEHDSTLSGRIDTSWHAWRPIGKTILPRYFDHYHNAYCVGVLVISNFRQTTITITSLHSSSYKVSSKPNFSISS